ncbi:MAG: DinB family protein, partial [bacterium]
MSYSPRRHLAGLALPLALAFALPTHAAIAQDAIDSKSATHIRDQYMADLDTVHAKILALATAIPAEKYDWRPAAGVRSVSQVLMHVTHEYYYYVPSSLAGKTPAGFGDPNAAEQRLAKITKKSEVLAELAKAWAHTKAQVASADAAHLTGKYKPWGITIDQAALSMSG